MNNGGEPDLHRIIHGMHLELSEKDRSDKAQVKVMLETIGKFIGAQLKPLQKQIEELKTQVDELKRKGISYKGVYQKSCEYAVGDLVSFDRSVWCAIQPLRKLVNRPVHSQANGRWHYEAMDVMCRDSRHVVAHVQRQQCRGARDDYR